ncbi:hypothetical protein ASG29_04905 [Sphingomonas sp. Leaf412]|uniref:SPOR domain-containing protein n=1 Tax=Sphingomonas sp. Leaf412 TaxID=1736370 RepID=UPI0006F85947|nr:SPOR domain-containing protein [Sphingomonas sp. Leaf412]KQT33398.1 hypothetical protein ASG29_04905 [Sphingomonas sp. Leaf412]
MKLHVAGAGLAVLLVAGTVSAVADSRHDSRQEKKASQAAVTAGKALKKHQWEKAILAAEAAVALNPGDAGYRALLGSAYLKGGRFASAETAYHDVLTLQPDNAQVALNMALAQVGAGRWAEARATLDRHASGMNPADRGLAIALAGDPAAAVEILTAATRTPGADAKTRQNLALAMALAGQWQEARALVGLDLAPLDADRRIVEWAEFARPGSASDQVARLLGVTPVADPGQPVALALAGTVPVVAAKEAPIESFMPGPADPVVEEAAVEAPARGPVAVPAAVELAQAPVAASVMAAPVTPRLIAAPAPYKIMTTQRFTPRAVKAPSPRVAARPPAKGEWVVQIGAFQNAAVAKDAWTRAARRFPTLAGHVPGGVNMALRGANFYRLSVGGFARADAVSLCRSYRAKGGVCFVRHQAGDQIASWARPKGIQLASR